MKSNSRTRLRQHLCARVSTLALIAALPWISLAVGDEARAAERADAAPVEEIVVSGSRIVRDGYEAPTPVSVLTADQLSTNATTTLNESVARLPVFAGSTLPRGTSFGISSGSAGLSLLDLRGLGSNRTLVLLDGQRVVSSSFTSNAVDISNMPAALVSRVDVVTGGASAAYGSDAVAGVVNFILDREFVGIKGEAGGSITTYGDAPQYKLNVTAGTAFGDGRGHFLFSGEKTSSEGAVGLARRPWALAGWQVLQNPAYTATNGLPQFLVRDHVGIGAASQGGLITAGPLKGIAFGPGGTPYNFRYGDIVSGLLMRGGEWATNRFDLDLDLDPEIHGITAFSRVSYDITDDVTAFAQVQFGQNHSFGTSIKPNYMGTLSIAVDNAFLPTSVRSAMVANNVTSVPLGTLNQDLPNLLGDNTRIFRRFVLGLDGKFSAFDSNWTWNAYFQRSTTHLSFHARNNVVTANFMRAIDAVRNPNTGGIVCRSTLTNPTDGCVPYNVMGIGVNSDAAKAYVGGTSYSLNVVSQNVAAATVNGEPFSTWAGPVSLATGVEWRKEEIVGRSSTLDQARAFFAGNYQPTNGDYSVAEGFAEIVVPLAKNTSWAEALEVNAAVRATSYSTSGYVTTWKVGASYQVVDDLRFRATRSRDIRAPNLQDLFSPGRSGRQSVLDPFRNNAASVVNSLQIGNPLLKPEVADTTGIGAVLSPTFLPGFGASADFYNIDVGGAIATLDRQAILDRCYAGTTALCSFLERDASGALSLIKLQPANVNSLNTKGLDLEASYHFPLTNVSDAWKGSINLRAVGTVVFHLKTIDGTNVTDAVDGPSLRKFRYNVSAQYQNAPFSATITMRGVSSGVFDTTMIQCTSGCPASTVLHPTVDNAEIKGATVFDLALTYQIGERGHGAELYLTIDNIFNLPPPVIPDRSTGYYANTAVGAPFDLTLGRIFRVGVRFQM